MQCFKQIRLKGGNYVPCGKCPACLANRQRDWTFRLNAERDECAFFFWLTLTYSDEHLPLVDGRGAVKKEDCRYFFERLRKAFPHVKFKHFLVSEYGPDTIRPHYHTLLFVYTDADFERKRKIKQEILDFLPIAWPFGFCYNKSFHNHVFGYVTKYCCKPDLIGLDVPVPVFALISQGIGKNYISRIDASSMRASQDYRVYYHGSRMSLPRYYREKINPTSLGRDFLAQCNDDELLERYRRRHDKQARLAALDRLNEDKVLRYDEKRGFGSYGRKKRAEYEHIELNFINKLKQRKNE